MTFIRKYEWVIFIVVFSALLWGMRPAADKPHAYQGDDLRYMSYAVSMHDYGVFGLFDKRSDEPTNPGNANAPFYPALIAGVMVIDHYFADTVHCLVKEGPNAGCLENFQTIFFVQMLLGVLSLFLIYLTALQFSKNRSIAWISAVLALASGIVSEFSYLFMTEILILPLFCALTLACLILYQKKKLFWVFIITSLLAFLTLTRPSYLYLFYAFILFFSVFALLKRDRSSALHLVVLIVGFVVVVSPWALRNYKHFNSFALTTGGYAEAILVQRTNYNQMSWSEVGVAMVYWLPDFGDSLAESIFPESLYNKLGWHKNSYYAQKYRKQMNALAEQLGGSDKVLGYLITEQILTVKHVAVSIPLALRGTFIAKYWGLVGFIAFICLLAQTIRKQDYSILVMAMPLFYMVAFHAGLSVSIPRYNLPLLSLYALSMAYYIHIFITHYGRKIVKKTRNK